MKLAFSTLGCPNWNLDQIIDAARQHGYDGVELRFYQGSLDLVAALASFPGGPREFRHRLERVGLAICCLDSSVVLSKPDTGIGDAEQMIDLALALAAPYVRVFGGDVPEGDTRESCLKRAADKLARMGQRAAQRGLRVLLETHDAFSSGAQVAELLAAAGEVGTGAIWDVHHPAAMGETPTQTAKLIGRQTYHVHVKDGKGGGKLTPLGEGDVPLRDIVRELHAIGYKGYLSLEWEKAWVPELAEPEVAFPQAARYLSDLLKELVIPRG
jgi:sugar phosphate isomerase/epimerase